MQEILEEKEYLSSYVEKKYDIEQTKQNLEQEIKEQEVNLSILKQIKKVEDKLKIEDEKIKINENTIKEYSRKIEELTYQKQENSLVKNKPFDFIKILISFILIILTLISIFIIKNDIISAILIVLTLTNIVYISYKQYKRKEELYNNKDKEKLEQRKSKIEVLYSMIKNLEKQGQSLIKSKQEEQQKALEEIRNTYLGIAPIKVINELLQKRNIAIEIEVAQNKINENKLKIQSIGLDKSNILPKLENLAKLDEEYTKLEEQYENLNNQKEAIELAKQELEKAYNQIKQKLTPKFTNGLSEIMKNISQGKYTNIRFNEEDGIIVEIESGKYIPIEYLSIGTIDQLYLSLRLGSSKNMAKEDLPIILDETFAYFDNERLTNILEFLHNEYKNRQIIILSCTNREKEILENKNIPYNLILL